MPSMGHGSSEEPVVAHSGDGVYCAFPVTFTMAGDWEVTFVAETPDGRSGRGPGHDVLSQTLRWTWAMAAAWTG